MLFLPLSLFSSISSLTSNAKPKKERNKWIKTTNKRMKKQEDQKIIPVRIVIGVSLKTLELSRYKHSFSKSLERNIEPIISTTKLDSHNEEKVWFCCWNILFMADQVIVLEIIGFIRYFDRFNDPHFHNVLYWKWDLTVVLFRLILCNDSKMPIH